MLNTALENIGHDVCVLQVQSMEQHQEEQALQFGLVVDKLLDKVRQEFKIALEESLAGIPQLAAKKLTGKRGQPGDDLIAAASQYRILALSQYLQQELTKYVGSSVEEGFMIPDSCIQIPTDKELLGIKREYQMTLFWVETMTEAMNKAYQEALSACFPTVVSKLADKIDVGSRCLSMVACQPANQKKRCMREMQKRMGGMVRSYFIRVEYEITSIFAQRAYQLYDKFITCSTWENKQILCRPFISRRQQMIPAV